jgi:hypothetical protein
MQKYKKMSEEEKSELLTGEKAKSVVPRTPNQKKKAKCDEYERDEKPRRQSKKVVYRPDKSSDMDDDSEDQDMEKSSELQSVKDEIKEQKLEPVEEEKENGQENNEYEEPRKSSKSVSLKIENIMGSERVTRGMQKKLETIVGKSPRKVQSPPQKIEKQKKMGKKSPPKIRVQVYESEEVIPVVKSEEIGLSEVPESPVESFAEDPMSMFLDVCARVSIKTV